MNSDIKKILIDENTLKERIRELGRILAEEYRDRNPIVLCVLKGAFIFMADLVKEMDCPLQIDFMAVSSYNGTHTSGEVKIVKDLDASLEGRDILIVEDILDTGLTLSFLKKSFEHRGARSIRICTLLLKDRADSESCNFVTADYVGFTVPDEFVVGYGLDYNERYRNLPYIGVLREEVYS
ncbi:MAG: hypoxanthine phosphoribosyltransferase [Eubacteriaceae bacterium]|nr:hypoxanthine phosphoribosyltransferase [Eubacteriaceae bacterium]